ncbi:MAG: Trk system potassium transporter TrkA [bacterium]
MEIVIIGAGDIGFHLCKRLTADKNNITIIESDAQKIAHANEYLDANVIEGSGCSKKILRKANIENADILAALTNNDEVNIIACQIAKKLNVPTTILRVRNPEYLNNNHYLSNKELGADYIIQPELQTANAIVQLIRQANATDIVEFENGKIQLSGIRLDSNAKILRTQLMDLGKKFGNPAFRILAIKRKQFTIIPKGEDVLVEGDQIYIICEKEYLPNALELFGKSNVKNENIMIIGGGLVGEFVAKELEDDINIKIFESNERKSELLAENLKRTLVIKGDGSDLDLLTFEGLADMDEFIALSGDDETNIITTLVAHHLRVPRTITLVRKFEYLSMTHAIGIDSIVNKQMITVNAIKQIIGKKKHALFVELPGMDAEIVEFVANDKSKIIRKTLMKTDFPKDAIVGTVIRKDGSIEIPLGSTLIKPGDKVVVFSLPKALAEVEKLF